jgi:hypothetical protein
MASFDDLSRREKDERWAAAHQKQIASRKKMLVDDGMDPAKAESHAKRMQEKATNKAREMTEGRG